MRRNKYDIKVYTRYYMRLVILFSILFIGVLWGPISLYCIEKKPVNVSIMYRPPKVRPKNLTIGGRYFYGKIQL